MGKVTREMKMKLNKYCRNNTDYIIACAEASMFGEELESVCVSCEEEMQTYERDIRYAHCENCGKYGVFGFEELMFKVAR